METRLLLRMTRPGFLVVTAVACLLGFATALKSGAATSAPHAIAALVLALLFHAGANVLNDYEDARNGADAANADALFPFTGGSRLIQQGSVSEGQTLELGVWLLGLGVTGGVALAAAVGPVLLPLGAAGLLIAWAYSSPPLALMSRGLGEVAVASAWALVVLGADCAASGGLHPAALAAGSGLALLVANILLINGLPDARADAAVGKRTLAVRLGPAGARRAYLALGLAAAAAPAAFALAGWAPRGAMASVATLPLSLAAWRLLRPAAPPAPVPRQAIVLTISAAVAHGLAVALGVLLA